MSDPKRANLITVGAPKSAKKNVTKTVRLIVNLDESNESKYPELNYRELVATAERKKKTENGKTGAGLDPFSDNDDDVERVAKKFEQKYGSRSTYGKKGTKKDEFADIGAGYDENDSFIDNTDGYDEMIPPECDTLYGGFYINSGSLEFKQVPKRHNSVSDNEGPANRRNKRRISSSSSEDESSESSSDSESQEEKDPKSGMVNGNTDSHKTDHRKKKNKKPDKKNAKRIRRANSAATSGKQTSDDNAHGDAESGDSRTSQSDSLTSKPAPSSENAITSDSSRDAATDQKLDMKLPSTVNQILEEMKACIRRHKQSTPNATVKDLEAATDSYVIRLQRALNTSPQSTLETSVRRAAWSRAARVLDTSREKLTNRARILASTSVNTQTTPAPPVQTATTAPHVPRQIPQVKPDSKPAKREEPLEMLDIKSLSAENREEKINETLKRLKTLIDERKPSMMLIYKNECERVREENAYRKKMIENAGDGAPHIEKRLPKRRFPWCQRTRALLTRLTQLSADEASAARLLAQRALPLFPVGFVRIPTLLRQANLNRELSAQVKPSELKRHNSVSTPLTTTAVTTSTVTTAPAATTQAQRTDIHFPSSLTVTATMKTENANESPSEPSASKQNSQLPVIFNSFSLNKNLIVEPRNDKEDKHRTNKSSVIVDKGSDRTKPDSDKYTSNNIGAITITPVPNNQRPPVKVSNNTITITAESKSKDSAIRVKSQATLIKEADEIAKKDKSKHKHSERSHSKHVEKRLEAPLHIDTSHPKEQKKVDTQKVSPSVAKNDRVEEISLKQIETMRVAENNIPRPNLVAVHHSPTFAKPDKRAPDPKKPRKDVIVLSDSETLGDAPTDDSDIELIEDISTVNDQLKQLPKKIIENPNSNIKMVNDLRVKDSIATNRETSYNNHKKFDAPHNSQHSRSVPKEKSRIVEKVNSREPRHEVQKPSNNLEKMIVDEAEVNVDEINKVMQNIREMQGSQEHIFNSNTYTGVITNAKHLKTSSNSVDMFSEARNEKNKLTNFFEQNGWM